MQRDLKEWLTDLETRHAQEINLGLSRVETVAQKLTLHQLPMPVISVAGTNGKGSTVATLEAIYCEAGFRVGSYTSPHLLHFNERIKINKNPISDKVLVAAFEVIESERGDVPLTYFEMVTLAALWIFKQQPLDLVILEVGLGGRLDATNVVDNDLAIITTIAFDHHEYLGTTLEAIGYEKAGIMRANKPCIYADLNPPLTILQEANRLEVPLMKLGHDYHYTIDAQGFCFQHNRENINLPKTQFHPHAIAAAIMALRCLQEVLPIHPSRLAQGLKNIVLLGRHQVKYKEGKTLVFDVAHNPQSAAYLADFIEASFPSKVVHAVFSGLDDKDISGMIEPLMSKVSYWYPARLWGKRAISSEKLLEIFRAHEINLDLCHNSPFLAYQAAFHQAHPGDLIVVYGSFLTVAAVLEKEGL